MILAERQIFPRSNIVLIISDCQSAIDVATNGGGQTPKLSHQCVSIIRQLQTLGLHVKFAWIPSHDKSSPFCQPSPFCAESDMRRWNEIADQNAKQCMRQRLAGSMREAWHVQRQAAVDWEVSAIRLCAEVGRQYHEHLDELANL